MTATPLPAPLDAEIHRTDGKAGPMTCYVRGQGRPLLLLHSINAAGSAYEIRPIFEHYATERRVYAPDLPGFGRSDRSDRDYDIRLYTNAVHDLLDLAGEDGHGERPDALALSLTSEFLARAANESPGRLRSLAFVTPTGFRKGSEALRGPDGSSRRIAPLAAFLRVPLWRKPLYKLLVRPGTIRFFLKKTWGSDAFDEGLAAYDDLTTHQPGAERAPLAFLSGELFAADIRNVYEQITHPVWLAHGTRGDFKDFSEANWTADRQNWTRQSFDTGALPHFEVPAAFFSAYDGFMASLPRR